MRHVTVGDVIDFEGYIGMIVGIHHSHLKVDWMTKMHPQWNYRSQHADADFYAPTDYWGTKFKLICNVHDFS